MFKDVYLQCFKRSTYEVVDEVQVMSGSDGHHSASSSSHPSIGLVQGDVNKAECVHHSIPVTWRHGQILVSNGEVARWHIL